MMQAVEKYGFFKGIFKGINRLYRCKPPFGGFDYP
jgi:putative component of membrane protein insertase Oxa1/YidC/SpoIIIJ protein YidD